MNKIHKNEYFLAVLSAVLFTLPFISPHFSILAWVCLLPLLVALESKPERSFRLGLVFGIVANYIGQYWLVGTLTRFGGFPIPVSVIFIFFYCLYLGLQFAFFSYFATAFGLIKNKGIFSILLIGCLWVALEYFFPHLFPYGLGNTQAYNLTILQVSDLMGVYLLSFFMVVVNVSLYYLFRSVMYGERKPLVEISFSVLIVIFLVVYGTYRIGQEEENIKRAEKIKIGVVQANYDFFEKIEDNERIITEEHQRMSHEIKDADLIIWPETAVQRWLPPGSEYLEFFEGRVIPEIEGTYFLLGGLSYEVEDGGKEDEVDFIQYNSAFLTDWNGKLLGKYNKIKLLLFGEYLPFSDLIPSLKYISPASGDFTPGSSLELLRIRDKGIKIGPLICYEDIIPSFSLLFVRKGANILINLTNDAWFGRSIAPYEHLMVSIPRSVETRRYLIRSTNTGVSVIIDSTGKITNKTGIFTKEVFEGEAALLYGETLYTKIGDIFPWLCLVAAVLYAFNKYLRKRYI